jgi:hypothetical protein
MIADLGFELEFHGPAAETAQPELAPRPAEVTLPTVR